MTSGSARPRHSAQRLQSGVCFTRLQSFDNLQASEFAATQVVPTASIQCGCRGGRGVYIRAERGSLPNRASDMLAVRIGQLTAEVFHLLDLQPCWLLRSFFTPKRGRWFRRGLAERTNTIPGVTRTVGAHRDFHPRSTGARGADCRATTASHREPGQDPTRMG